MTPARRTTTNIDKTGLPIHRNREENTREYLRQGMGLSKISRAADIHDICRDNPVASLTVLPVCQKITLSGFLVLAYASHFCRYPEQLFVPFPGVLRS